MRSFQFQINGNADKLVEEIRKIQEKVARSMHVPEEQLREKPLSATEVLRRQHEEDLRNHQARMRNPFGFSGENPNVRVSYWAREDSYIFETRRGNGQYAEVFEVSPNEMYNMGREACFALTNRFEKTMGAMDKAFGRG